MRFIPVIGLGLELTMLVGSDTYEPTAKSDFLGFGNHIWLCWAVSVLGGGDARRNACDSSECVNPADNVRGLPNLQFEPGGAKPGQRRRAVMRGGLRTLSRRGSGVRIPAPAPEILNLRA